MRSQPASATRCERSRGGRRFRTTALAAAVLCAAAGFPSTARAQEPGAGKSFGEAARVTAIDLAVEVHNALGSVPTDLAAGDLAVTEDGEAQTVVGVAPLGSGEGEEALRLVLYFDLTLARPATVAAAALALGERAQDLVSLGEVEVMVADPAPEPLLGPTRDRSLVETALGRVLAEYKGKDALTALRRTVLAAGGGPGSGGSGSAAAAAGAGGSAEELPPGLDPGELAAGAVAEETSIVHGSQDSLLTWAAAEGGGGPKALLLVSDGFDLDPGAFYAAHLPGAPASPGASRELAESTTALARTLAGYGWLVFPVVLKEANEGPSETSAEFEKFRRRGLDGLKGDNSAMVGKTIPLGGKKRKEEEAAAAKEEQAVALAQPRAPLAELAAAGAGAVVDKPAGLDDVLTRLDDSYRVTFQVSRPLDGRLHAVEVRSRRGSLRVKAPGWVRSGAPQGLAEARVRRMRSGWFEVGDLALVTRFRRAAAAGGAGEGLISGTLETRLDLTGKGPKPPQPERATLRLTVAYGTEEGNPSFQHQLLGEQDLSGPAWSYSKPLTLPADAEWMIVLVEELGSGAWGARDLEP
jgi:hypothetical protein